MREPRDIDENWVKSLESDVYRALGLTVDTAQGLVYLNGGLVHLRPRTFLLLQFLIDNRHRLVEKTEIFATVWKDATVSDATLVGCVQEIRRALNDDPKAPCYIRTVPRRGYQFIAPLQDSAAPGVKVAEEPPPAAACRSYWLHALIGGAAVLSAVVFASLRTGERPERSLWEVAWFKLDHGALEDTAENLTAPKEQGAARRVQGVLGGAIQFDGVSAVLDGHDPRGRLPRGDSPRTISAWIRTRSTNGDASVIVNVNSNGGSEFSPDNFSLVLLKSGHVAWSRNGRADVFARREVAVSKQRVDDGNWHFLAGRFHGAPSNKGSVFVDGVESEPATMRLTGPFVPSTVKWAAGNGVVRGSYFRGEADDIRIFERALSPATIAAMHRCVAGAADVDVPGRGAFYFAATNAPDSEGPSHLRIGATIENTGTSFAGVHLIRRVNDCGLRGIRAGDVGQDIYMAADILAPTNAEGLETQAGPFLRSRRAAPGDGIIGGTSAGFWVRLHSTGAVSVRRLNPSATIAFAQPAARFDASVFHRLEVAAKATAMQVTLDGKPVTFDQGGKMTSTVVVEPAWEKLADPGINAGTAGIYFGAEGNISRIGGQQAKNLRVESYRPLFQ
jgi:DNA-binding winged helix-turn-helix (wHTH) protein